MSKPLVESSLLPDLGGQNRLAKEVYVKQREKMVTTIRRVEAELIERLDQTPLHGLPNLADATTPIHGLQVRTKLKEARIEYPTHLGAKRALILHQSGRLQIVEVVVRVDPKSPAYEVIDVDCRDAVDNDFEAIDVSAVPETVYHAIRLHEAKTAQRITTWSRVGRLADHLEASLNAFKIREAANDPPERR